MTDGLKMALTIGVIVVLVAIGLMGANRAKVATETKGTEAEEIGNTIMEGLTWD